MKIYLPWKTLGHDNNKYQATIDIVYSNTQNQELNKRADILVKEKNQELVKYELKKEKGGRRKCPLHKFPKVAIYSDEGQCSICRGYKK